jgi:NAD(P)-dependent dehydrogenase (short-subunit alcohol dehydrogenase family)
MAESALAKGDQVAVVTGAGRGLGRVIALRLGQAGFAVALAGPEQSDLQQLAAEMAGLGQTALPVVVDVRDEAQVQQMAAQVRGHFSHIDLLVNNAGIIGPTAGVQDVHASEWNDVLAVNLTGAFYCCKAVLTGMYERRQGKIINISSIAGKFAYALRSPYAVSKWGLIGLTLTMAREAGPFNVQVNAICPGPVEGSRMQKVIADKAAEQGRSEADVKREYLDRMALGQFVQPQDVAEAVAFLASPAGDRITGQTLDVTAGYGL